MNERALSKGEETRRTILDHALSLTSSLGLEGVSLGALAREAGMSKSGLFAHFDSKEELQAQVLDVAAARFAETVVVPALVHPRGEPRVVAMFENWLTWEAAPFQPGGCVFIAAAHELDDRPGPLRERLVVYQRQWLDTLARAAAIAVEEGHFRADLDREQFAYDLYAVILAYHHFGRLLREPDAEGRARTAFARLLAAARPRT